MRIKLDAKVVSQYARLKFINLTKPRFLKIDKEK